MNTNYQKHIKRIKTIPNGIKKNTKRIDRNGQKSARWNLSWTHERIRIIQVGSNNNGTIRFTIRRRSFLPQNRVPGRLSIQTTQYHLHDQGLPSQCEPWRQNMRRYPQDSLVSSFDNSQDPFVNQLSTDWTKWVGPTGARYRHLIQIKSWALQFHCPRVDQ